MTQKEIDKFLADTKVYVAGKSKEIQEKLFSLGYKWVGNGPTEVQFTEKPFLFIYDNGYISYTSDMSYFVMHPNREIIADEIISLELTEPSCRPFKDKEECWKEMLKHEPFGWIKSIPIGSFALIGCIYQHEGKAYVTYSTNEDESILVDSVFKAYTFADGTPFGIKEE